MSLDPSAATPDRALVLEVLGPVAAFAEAAAESGFEWLAEDYRIAGTTSGSEDDETGDEQTPGGLSRLYLAMPTMAGLRRLLAWWKSFSSGEAPANDLAKRWWHLFGYLADVRVWGVQDRIDPSLEPYLDRVLAKRPNEPVQVEFDLWFLGSDERRALALASLEKLLSENGAAVLDKQVIPEIRFHGALVSLPAEIARQASRRVGPLATAAMVMTIRPQSLASFDRPPPTTSVGGGGREIPDAPAGRPPVAVLLDGYPVENHDLLRNRVDVEEIDVTGADAPLASRFHGTAMASLILHGDLSDGEPSLDHTLKVVPILAAPQGAHAESTPPDKLPLAMIYRAVEAVAGRGGSAPEAILFNHSICDVSAPFVRRPSPWAKLLDHLSHKHRILFVVSAGNIHEPILLPAYRDQVEFAAAEPLERGLEILRSIEAAKGTRGLLSPAEGVNVLTVGALHADGSGQCPAPHVDPFEYAAANIGSAVGLGVNRSVKPDIVLAGGRQVALAVPHSGGFAFAGREIDDLGMETAAPDMYGATLDFVRRSTGTSNAAALATRSGIQVAQALEAVVAQSGQRLADQRTRAAMVKALLIHGSGWGEIGSLLDRAYPPEDPKWRRRRETITRFLGFGRPAIGRVLDGETNRITLLADDEIAAEQLHEYRIPVPQDLLGSREFRRITLTLAWSTPIHPTTTAYRGIALDLVDADGKRGFWDAVKPSLQPHPDDSRRGTVIHRIYEGTKRVKAIPSAGLFVGVQARCLHDDFAAVAVPYALAVSIEVGQTVRTDVDIYSDVRSRARLRARIRERV